VISAVDPGDAIDDQAQTIGQPMPHVEVKIGDPDSGAVLPIGAAGEICIRGYQTMIGYFNMPEATAKTIDTEGWLHSGDLGSMDERGYLKITGRLRDLIKRGGESVYPREIELLLLEHPKVGAAAVVGFRTRIGVNRSRRSSFPKTRSSLPHRSSCMNSAAPISPPLKRRARGASQRFFPHRNRQAAEVQDPAGHPIGRTPDAAYLNVVRRTAITAGSGTPQDRVVGCIASLMSIIY